MEEFKCYVYGAELDPVLLDENRNWQETLDTLSHELEEAGLQKAELLHAATFFYAACLEQQGLILAGPFGESMAKAVSAAIWGQYPAVLDCSVPYSHNILEEMETDKNQAVIIKNIFQSNWLIPLLDAFHYGKKQVFIVHPFAEDLFVEADSFFEYAFPVLTDMIIESKPGNEFVGGSVHADILQVKNPIRVSPVLKELMPDGFMRRKTSRLLNLIEQMSGSEYEDIAWKYIYFPYAYLTGKLPKLEEKMDGSISGQVRAKLKSYFL